MFLLFNFAAFQVGWFSAVIGAARGMPWAGPAVIAIIVFAHLLMARRPMQELTLIGICGLFGAILDSALVAAGWVSYPSGYLVTNAAPYWIVAMWMLFGTTLNVSMNWLKGRPLLAFGFGLTGGPLAYYTGNKLGGIVFDDLYAAIIALGLGWGIMMPILLALAERYDGISESPGDRYGRILD
ncbi:MAG: DUF2878 domain-containing protein [Gammaproteobacteria bacterium]|nr:DUF2878 domain-containing protein [Gammaproteobacteria bacterium]MDH4254023.1 DUF2878 domain-containing protein [Gammaproteobacteria bacterium]MDH5310322.1 DUF2878 domain-containing protein [Gammaproteobacteria bacterium]